MSSLDGISEVIEGYFKNINFNGYLKTIQREEDEERLEITIKLEM